MRKSRIIRSARLSLGALGCAAIVSLAVEVHAATWWERLLGSAPAAEEPAGAGSVEEERGALPPLDIASGLREALIVGSERVVAQLARPGGFSADPQLHIALPASLQSVRDIMDRAGLGAPIDDLEVKLNEAAEAATPKAKALFVDAIRTMTIDDARGILEGGDTAATDYLRSRMAAPLAEEMRPIIDASLEQVGAARMLDVAMTRYREIPFAPALDVDLDQHVTDGAIDGIFIQLAKEEQAIREDPAQRTTELLRSVFGV